jgi:hypothetical protein
MIAYARALRFHKRHSLSYHSLDLQLLRCVRNDDMKILINHKMRLLCYSVYSTRKFRHHLLDFVNQWAKE